MSQPSCPILDPNIDTIDMHDDDDESCILQNDVISLINTSFNELYNVVYQLQNSILKINKEIEYIKNYIAPPC